MQNRGKLVACDTAAWRLERSGQRLRRAGVSNVERRALASERDPWVKHHAKMASTGVCRRAVPRHRQLAAQPRRQMARDAAAMTDKILILDFGSQVTQLIARRVRENGVYCEIHPYTMSDDASARSRPRGIILSGGPASVTQATTPRAPDIVFTLGVPVLASATACRRCARNWAAASRSATSGIRPRLHRHRRRLPLFEGLWPKGHASRCG
jgi:hypothetical protein